MKNLRLQLLVAVFSVTVLNAQSPLAPNVRLVSRSGLVEVQRGDVWLPITVGESVYAGERIRTANGSTAAIEIGPGNVITLNQDSQVRLAQSPAVQLEGGSIKVFAASDIQLVAKDTMLESVEGPLDLELGYQADKLNLTIFNGAVRSGSMIIRGSQDPKVRTYTADGRSSHNNGEVVVNPAFYVYPDFMYRNPNPNAGRIVPPVVNNPTNPGYRPTQIVPPMSDPIRVPVTTQ